MSPRVAVVGAGMSRFVRRAQETGKELSWIATREALASCELKLEDVDAVCLTSAPDAFDGVHRKGDYLADGAGAWAKPYMRTYVGGGSGVFTAIQGWYTVASGLADVVVCVAEEKMSSCQPHPQGAFLTIFDNILERPLGPNLLWIFALEMQRYMQAYGLDKRDIAQVAVKNKRNAADHPAALLGTGRHHRRGRAGERDPRMARPAPRRFADLRRRGRDRDGLRGRGEAAHRSPRLDPRRRLEPRHDLLDEPGPRVPRVRRERRAHGLRDGRGERAPEGDPGRRALRPVRLQGAAPPRRPAALRPREGARGRGRRRDRPGRGPPVLSLRRSARGREPDRRRRADEDRRALLAAPRRGRRTPGPRDARARRRPGVGRPDAGRDRGRDGERRRTACDGHAIAAVRARAPRPCPIRSSAPRPGPSSNDSTSATSGTRARRSARSWTACANNGSSRPPASRAAGRWCRPRKFCERCFRPTDGWTEVPHTGTVETFSICHVTWDMRPLDEPQIPAVIRLDGTSEGGFLHLLGEVAPDDVRAGMQVEAVWKPAGERVGSILDIRSLPAPRARAPSRAGGRRGRRTTRGGAP